ncbi:MAG: PhzF family phenazine biosynthesis isomerase [Pseudomonadota bacterium]
MIQAGDLNDPLRLAAFCRDDIGGNPAGVVFVDAFPAADVMLGVAADLGYSETAFVSPTNDGYALRYFAPQIEVPFCGHATVAAVAAIGQRTEPGEVKLTTPAGPVEAHTARNDAGQWSGGFVAPPATDKEAPPGVVSRILDAFGLHADALDHELGPALCSAGAKHIQVGLRSRARLAGMNYDMASLGPFMREHAIATVNLLWRENSQTFHSRNAFASGGIFEDPATGAAAAALGGYLQTRGLRGNVRILQGDDMGIPCRINVVLGDVAANITVSGDVRVLDST